MWMAPIEDPIDLFQAQFYNTALEYYFDQLKVVLETFNSTLDDLGLPKTFQEFASLVKKCLVLEFIIVTVVKPILMIPGRFIYFNCYHN